MWRIYVLYSLKAAEVQIVTNTGRLAKTKKLSYLV